MEDQEIIELYGGNDDDIIISGAGSNLLDGGPGNDVLSAVLETTF